MTVSQLHALYCAAYVEARGLSDGGVTGAVDLEVDGRGLTALERVILEFVLHDLTNGTPMRSRRDFERAVSHGAKMLGALGLRAELDAAASPARVGAAPQVAEAWRGRIRRPDRMPGPAYGLGGGASGAAGRARTGAPWMATG